MRKLLLTLLISTILVGCGNNDDVIVVQDPYLHPIEVEEIEVEEIEIETILYEDVTEYWD